MQDKIIVGIGELLWDVFPGNKKILGGAPVNFAYHVSQFGYKGYGVSAVGNDELGDEILSSLGQKKMNYVINQVDFPTGTVQVTLATSGVPQYEIRENVAWDNIAFTKELEELARKTNTVCFGSLAQRSEVSRGTINKFLDCLSPYATKIFDINLRQHFYNLEIIEDSLHRSNILKINDEEIVELSRFLQCVNKSETDICNILLKRYDLKMVILTKGIDGSYVVTEDQISFKPTPVVEVADTVGAGDSFTAGFVAGILKGKSINEAHQIAVDISAYVCTQHGAMPFLPDSLVYGNP